MRIYARFFRRYAACLVAIVIICILHNFARLPTLSETERKALAARFRFSPVPFPELACTTPCKMKEENARAVHTSLDHISAWISSVGAAVALHDLDGDGYPNDLCYVDTRTDRVIVAPVPGTEVRKMPGTEVRYKPFALKLTSRLYDPATMAPMGCLPGDVNEDGFTDLIVYYWGRTPIAFLHTGEGGLQVYPYVPQELIPEAEAQARLDKGRWYTNAATLADLDGDGHVDLVIGNYFKDGSHILNALATGTEQMPEMQDSMSLALNGGHSYFLLWTQSTAGAEPTVKFRVVSGGLTADVPPTWTLAIGAADLDGDLLPELYFANDFGPDQLLHNRSSPGHLHFVPLKGKKKLTTPNSKVVGRGSFKGMGIDFGDLNGDGWLDMYVSNIAAQRALEESHLVFLSTSAPQKKEYMQQDVAPYEERSEALGLSRSGWSWEARLGDFNNDGILEALQATGFVKGEVDRWPELHELAMGNDNLLHRPGSWPGFQPGDDLSGKDRNPFFVRASDGRYYDLAHELGLDTQQVSRGIATADVDGDGRLDFAVANQWISSWFYHNESPHPGEFVGLHLFVSLQPNTLTQPWAHPDHPSTGMRGRPAIGAEATVCLPDERRLVAQVDGGNGHSGKPNTLAQPWAHPDHPSAGMRGCPAIRAEATVCLPGERRLVAQVDGGNGHSGKRSPDLHFGLGDDITHDTQFPVVICWRDPRGRVQQEILSLTPKWYTVVLGWPAD